MGRLESIPLAAGFLLLHPDVIASLKIVPVLQAKTRVNKLLREHLYREGAFATVQAALELNLNRFVIAMLKKHIAGLKAIQSLFGLLPSLYVSVQFTVFGYRMPPKLATAARFLAFFQLHSLFFLVFWQLHTGNIENSRFYK